MLKLEEFEYHCSRIMDKITLMDQFEVLQNVLSDDSK